ncbi:hypothetical protein AVEN_1184-1 [Araneus ventricosus]|uniref:Uncharacterized protein n=1 Tax=Araneus ventricosus TaxID=182803 RepID=A0A4Y2EBX1_ARAVE|nr:hypothetical protein AVEN_1184-1 [Araneus ventricosus]
MECEDRGAHDHCAPSPLAVGGEEGRSELREWLKSNRAKYMGFTTVLSPGPQSCSTLISNFERKAVPNTLNYALFEREIPARPPPPHLECSSGLI